MTKFGEQVPGYSIPVLNEREIRASAGIIFVFMFIALMRIIFEGDFLLIKYTIVLFLLDMTIRVFLSPRYSPALIIGRLIVRNQNPEYVGAAQKKFAWIIGVALSSTMFLLIVVMNTYSILTGIVCLICLTFLFFESAFGICLGCIVYKWFSKSNIQYCPGEICDTKARQEIQKVSWYQVIIVICFITVIYLLSYWWQDAFSIKPSNLWTYFK